MFQSLIKNTVDAVFKTHIDSWNESDTFLSVRINLLLKDLALECGQFFSENYEKFNNLINELYDKTKKFSFKEEREHERGALLKALIKMHHNFIEDFFPDQLADAKKKIGVMIGTEYADCYCFDNELEAFKKQIEENTDVSVLVNFLEIQYQQIESDYGVTNNSAILETYMKEVLLQSRKNKLSAEVSEQILASQYLKLKEKYVDGYIRYVSTILEKELPLKNSHPFYKELEVFQNLSAEDWVNWSEKLKEQYLSIKDKIQHPQMLYFYLSFITKILLEKNIELVEILQTQYDILNDDQHWLKDYMCRVLKNERDEDKRSVLLKDQYKFLNNKYPEYESTRLLEYWRLVSFYFDEPIIANDNKYHPLHEYFDILKEMKKKDTYDEVDPDKKISAFFQEIKAQYSAKEILISYMNAVGDYVLRFTNVENAYQQFYVILKESLPEELLAFFQKVMSVNTVDDKYYRYDHFYPFKEELDRVVSRFQQLNLSDSINIDVIVNEILLSIKNDYEKMKTYDIHVIYAGTILVRLAYILNNLANFKNLWNDENKFLQPIIIRSIANNSEFSRFILDCAYLTFKKDFPHPHMERFFEDLRKAPHYKKTDLQSDNLSRSSYPFNSLLEKVAKRYDNYEGRVLEVFINPSSKTKARIAAYREANPSNRITEVDPLNPHVLDEKMEPAKKESKNVGWMSHFPISRKKRDDREKGQELTVLDSSRRAVG